IQAWQRVPIPAWAPGAAVLAVTIDLLAAGGIGIPAVALMLWSLVALGLNLREDRRCGRLADPGRRFLGFGLALVWAALIGPVVDAAPRACRGHAPVDPTARREHEARRDDRLPGQRGRGAAAGLAALSVQRQAPRRARPGQRRDRHVRRRRQGGTRGPALRRP